MYRGRIMTLGIYTNTQSINTQRALNSNSGSLQTAVQRLASGKRINSATDDAAGLAISTRMNATAQSQSVVSRGINDAISLLQVAEGGLSSISNMLQRARELAVQASNGTLNNADRYALQQEFTYLIDDIDKISSGTSIFGKNPLAAVAQTPVPPISQVFPSDGSTIRKQSGIAALAFIPAGSSNVQIRMNSLSQDDDLQIFTKEGKHLLGTNLGDGAWASNGVTNNTDIETKVFNQAAFNTGASYDSSTLLDGRGNAVGNTLSSSYNGMNFTYSGDPHPTDFNESVNIDNTTEDLLIFSIGGGVFDASATGNWGVPSSSNTALQPINVVLDSTHGKPVESITIDRTPADATTLGLRSSFLNTMSNALLSIANIDSAINKISAYRGHYGANESMLNRAVDHVASFNQHTRAAISRIMDTDYAQETNAQIKSQILQNASQLVLSQANSSVKNILALLKI